MTVLIGLLCQDGIVIGSDSSATFGAGNIRTIEQPVKKIHIIENCVIVAGTGQVGIGQRFTAVVQELWNQNAFAKEKSHIEIGKRLSAAGINDFSSTKAERGCYGALVGFPYRNKPYLCELAIADFQPEFKDANMWYVSMGSGQPITDPFLGLMRRVFWKNSIPRLNDGVFAVSWALEHAIDVNPGGIKGPQQIAVLAPTSGKLSARLMDDSEIAEHIDSVRGAEEHLAKYSALLSGQLTTEAPDLS